MRLDLYHAETARIATEQSALLDMAWRELTEGRMLSPLEQNGVLHALQVLIEKAIGKAKQLLKARGETVPVSAYDAFRFATKATTRRVQPTPIPGVMGLTECHERLTRFDFI